MDIKNFSWFEGDKDVLFVYDLPKSYYAVLVSYKKFNATSFTNLEPKDVTVKDMEYIAGVARSFGTHFNNCGRAISYYNKDKKTRLNVRKDDYKLRNRLESQFND